MNEPTFSCFLGIDQTGAAVQGGAAAKPLPCAVARRTGNGWELLSRSPRTGKALLLAELNPRGLTSLFATGFGTEVPPDLALMVDCVFGLPESVCRGLGYQRRGAAHLWKLFGRASGNTAMPLFGRTASEAFFADLAADSAAVFQPLPRRRCELACGANSVFLTRPFQKNVQTGTHRIWRDVGAAGGRPWAHIWPFDPVETPADGRPWLFESYPSLLWRELLGLRTRDRTALAAAATAYCKGKVRLAVDDWPYIAADGERADAAVLALGGLALQRERRLFAPSASFGAGDRALPLEGWIAGLRTE